MWCYVVGCNRDVWGISIPRLTLLWWRGDGCATCKRGEEGRQASAARAVGCGWDVGAIVGGGMRSVMLEGNCCSWMVRWSGMCAQRCGEVCSDPWGRVGGRAEEWSGVSEALKIRRNGSGVGDENEGA